MDCVFGNLLSGVVALSKHDVVSVGPVDVEVDLSDVRAVQAGQAAHLAVLALLLRLHPVDVQQQPPQHASHPLRHALQSQYSQHAAFRVSSA